VKLGQQAGRAVIVVDDQVVDVEHASHGRFGSDPQALYEQWRELRAWADTGPAPTGPLDPAALGPPAPGPRQVFAIGLNYAGHAAESGAEVPAFPPTFTKFPTCLAGPEAVVPLPSDFVDWEVELVVVMAERAFRVPPGGGWDLVAGVTVGQDLSERLVQLRPPMPQFSLGKSFPGFGPTGPWLVTPDELPDRDDLAIGCTLNGEAVQSSRTSDLVFGVDALVHHLSSVTPLLPGDVIFTGTPAGVGGSRTPPRFLTEHDVVVSTVEGVGSITTRFTREGTPS
jgi:2-keto-4-pentenoate hydratase/2-oxohepta-3-ene-1,7-dioic acid hydratase in catechol pathway